MNSISIISRPRTRRLLGSLVLLALFFGLQSEPLTAAQRIRLGTLAPKGSSYYNEINQMGRDWTKETRRAISLTIYPDGRMGGEAQMVRRMRVGQLQAGLLTAVGLTEIEPTVSGLQNLPLMFDSLEEVDHIAKKLQPRLEDQLQKKGFKVLFWVNAGWVHFFSKAPVTTPDDLRKLKIFTWAGSPEVVEVYQSARFTPVPLETKDILPGLQTGLISAVPLPPFLANASQVDTRAPHMLDLKWAPLVGAAVITTKTWDRLDGATRNKAMEIAQAAGKRIQAIGRNESTQAIEAMKKRGLTVHPVDDATKQLWKQAAAESYDKIRGTIVPADTYDQVRTWINEFRQP